MSSLRALRDKIEKLDKREHISIIKIILKNKINYTENRNGIFLNMKDLNKASLDEIQKYLLYVSLQHEQLNKTEVLKESYAKSFFKDNKANCI